MLAQVLADLAADLVGARDERVEIAVLIEPFDRGLGAAFLDARYVIHGVAHQRQVIDDARRRHTELGLHPGLVEHFLAHGIDPAHPGPHQLGEVLVAGRDHHLPARFGRLPRERADHVVGFNAIDHQQRPALGLDRLVQRLDLGAQVVRHGRAVRLVFGIKIVAEGLALGVEYACAIFRLVVRFQPP